MPPKLKPALELPLPAVLPAHESLEANQRAVLALYDDTAVRLLRYARAFGLSDETAEDVVQDVFVALFRHLCLGRPRHSLTGWLFRVTRNLSLKQRQRQRGAPADLLTDLLLERLADPGHTPEERAAFNAALPAPAVGDACAGAPRPPVRLSALGRPAAIARSRRRSTYLLGPLPSRWRAGSHAWRTLMHGKHRCRLRDDHLSDEELAAGLIDGEQSPPRNKRRWTFTSLDAKPAPGAAPYARFEEATADRRRGLSPRSRAAQSVGRSRARLRLSNPRLQRDVRSIWTISPQGSYGVGVDDQAASGWLGAAVAATVLFAAALSLLGYDGWMRIASIEPDVLPVASLTPGATVSLNVADRSESNGNRRHVLHHSCQAMRQEVLHSYGMVGCARG